MYVFARFLRLIILGVVVYVLYKILWKGDWFPSLFSKNPKRRETRPHSGNVEAMKRDPVCGTFLLPRHAITVKSGRETHYFCSEECKQKFLELQKK
ncbi:MAG: hypothetical protein ACM3SY_03115 [Candidatus Omnitrophota bacterium]